MNYVANLAELSTINGIRFGTSGARGLVTDFTLPAVAALTQAFVCVLSQERMVTDVAVGIDLRPGSPLIAKYIIATLETLGIEPHFMGVLPTPALAAYALNQGMPAIMVTGSHIPFDRNGLKFYNFSGEISKADEQAMLAQPINALPLDAVETDLTELLANPAALEFYQQQFLQVLPRHCLTGKRIGIYQHSSAGRDCYSQVFNALGAEVVELGRSDIFVPIDTEAVSAEDKTRARQWCTEYKLDALFSTDGDGDRPLLADEQGNWFRGDILGLLCAKYLGIKQLAVPVSCNTAIEQSGFLEKVVRTRIGSPFVIAAFHELTSPFAGFEANGGFMLGSSISLNNQQLAALPTRDALLPTLAVLALAGDAPLSSLYADLPARYTASDRLQQFSTERSQHLLTQIAANPQRFLQQVVAEATLLSLDTTDGLRLTLNNGDIIHLRPSGNAPELRCYAESCSEQQAEDYIVSVFALIKKLTF
ncbi:MAG TPA: phosphomannomutase [Rheinheimera sp.]|uniref:phosphomannomutase n=1 Tax=Rheinheimera sp. TaxID=1869214 RepID=UPI002F9416AF